jgi:hypothetical protein
LVAPHTACLLRLTPSGAAPDQEDSTWPEG